MVCAGRRLAREAAFAQEPLSGQDGIGSYDHVGALTESGDDVQLLRL